MVGAHYGGEQIAAESGTRHVKIALLVRFELCAVGGESRPQTCRKSGSEVAADTRRAVKNNVRLIGFENLIHRLRILLRQIIFKLFVLHHVYDIRAVACKLFRRFLDFVAQNNRANFFLSDCGSSWRRPKLKAYVWICYLSVRKQRNILAILIPPDLR